MNIGTLEIILMANLARLRQEMNEADGIISGTTRRAAENLGKMGAAATAAGVVMGASLLPAIKAFSEFEAANARLKAALMTDKGLTANFQKVMDLAVELGNKLPGTTADFVDMFGEMSKLGVTEAEILGGAGAAAANLAIVVGLSYTEAAEIVSKLRNVTGVASADLVGFMDTIQRTTNQGVKATEMMMSFARAGGALAQYNIQGLEKSKELAVIFAQLISKGASGEKVGTGFQTIMKGLLEFTNGSTKGAVLAAEQLKDLQIQLKFFENGEFLGLDNFIKQLDKVKDLSQTDMGELFNKMFGGGADSAFVAQLAKAGVAGNKAMADSMAAQGDLTAKVAVQLDTLSAKWEAATGTWENTLAAMGQTIAPILKDLIDKFGSIAEAIGKVVKDNSEFFGWLGLGVGATAVGLVGVGALALTISGTVLAIGTIGSAITALSVLMAANPVVMTLLGFGAAYAAGNMFGKFVVKGWIDDLISKLSGTKGNTLGGAIFDLVDSVETGFKKIVKKLEALPTEIVIIINIAMDAAKTTIKQWTQIGVDIVMGMWQGIKNTAKKPLEAIKELAESLPEWARKLLKIASPSKVFTEIGTNIGDGLAKGIVESEGKVKGSMSSLLSTLFDKIDDNFNTTFLRMIETGKGNWQTFTKSLANTFKTTVADFIYKSLAKPFVLKMVMSLAGVVGLNGLASAAGKAIDTGGGDSSASWLSAGKGLWDGLSTGFKAFGDGIASSVTDLGISLANSNFDLLSEFGAKLINNSGAIGTGASYLGAGLAGVSIGTFIAGDKTLLGLDGLSSSAIGATIGAVAGGPIGAFIGGVAGGVFNAAFGHGPKKYGDTTVKGEFTGAGFEGLFATPWSQKGGWFSKNKNGVQEDALGAEAQSSLDALIGRSGSAFARLIALTGDASRSMDGWSFAIDRALVTQEDMTRLFGDMSDSLGTYVIPELEQFRLEGENLADTAIRLGDEFVFAQSIFDLLGYSAAETGIASLAMRDSLIQLMGGMQAADETMKSYYANFFSDQERLDNQTASLEAQFKSLGLEMPKTREEFRALAEVLVEDTTPAGLKLFAAVMKLNPAFAAITESVAGLADVAVATNQVIVDLVAARQQSRLDGPGVSNGIAQSVSNIKESVSGLSQALAAALKSTIDSTNPTSRAEAQAQVRAAIAIAKAGGVLPSAEDMQGALNAIAQPSEKLFRTFAEWQTDQRVTTGLLNELLKLSIASESGGIGGSATINAKTAAKNEQLAIDNARQFNLVWSALNGITIQNGLDPLAQAQYLRALTAKNSDYRLPPGFAVGTDYVQRDMTARIHEGERIIPRGHNANGNDEILSAVRDLIETVKAGDIAIAKNTAETAKYSKRWDGNGILVRAETTAPLPVRQTA